MSDKSKKPIQKEELRKTTGGAGGPIRSGLGATKLPVGGSAAEKPLRSHY